MARCLIVVVVLLGTISSAAASLAPRKDALPFEKRLPPDQGRVQWARVFPQEKAFRVTAETEVRLNGRPCKYEEVPADARIRHLEVGPDGQTILRVDFRK
jgi:hypothetical protein